jgi:hypothetical protein
MFIAPNGLSNNRAPKERNVFNPAEAIELTLRSYGAAEFCNARAINITSLTGLSRVRRP